MKFDKGHAVHPEAFLARMKGTRSAFEYRRGQEAFRQGDPADSVFYVRRGQAKLSVMSPAGRTAVVAIVQAGSFFGDECLCGHEVYLTTAKAITECTLIRLSKGSIAQLLHSDPEFSSLFVESLLERNIRAQDDLVDKRLNSTEKRLARLLLILANYEKENELEPAVPKISQETLAEMTGTTRTHINYFMIKFKKLGLIEGDGAIRVNRTLINMLLGGDN
jgi:CRP-like cAMP-binding protein